MTLQHLRWLHQEIAAPTVDNHTFKVLVEQNQHALAPKDEIVGCHKDIKVIIDTMGGGPVKRRVYRMSFSKRAAFDSKITELLEKGVIHPSSSP